MNKNENNNNNMYTQNNPSLTIAAPKPRYGNHAARSKKLHAPNGFVPAQLADDLNTFKSHMPIGQHGIDGQRTNHDYNNNNNNIQNLDHRRGYEYNNGNNGNYNHDYYGGRSNMNDQFHDQTQGGSHNHGYNSNQTNQNMDGLAQFEQQYIQQQINEHNQTTITNIDAMSTDGGDKTNNL